MRGKGSDSRPRIYTPAPNSTPNIKLKQLTRGEKSKKKKRENPKGVVPGKRERGEGRERKKRE